MFKTAALLVYYTLKLFFKKAKLKKKVKGSVYEYPFPTVETAIGPCPIVRPDKLVQMDEEIEGLLKKMQRFKRCNALRLKK